LLFDSKIANPPAFHCGEHLFYAHVLTKSQLADARNKFTVNGTRSCNIKQNKNKNSNEKFILRWRTGTRDG
jgi:hypothetical protein